MQYIVTTQINALHISVWTIVENNPLLRRGLGVNSGIPTVPRMTKNGTVENSGRPPSLPFPRLRSRNVPDVVNDHFVFSNLIHDKIFANRKS
jgi:hypothetical protein